MMDAHRALDARFALDRRADEEFAEYLREILDNYLHGIFVATREEEVVGYAIVAEMENPPVFEPKRYGFVCEICVAPRQEGQGIGKVLFERTRRWFERRGLTVVQLNVSPRNERGLKFYEELGFKPFLNILWLDLAQGRRGESR
jgi:ribosomal protein S18 acetylase RimI-like enzyme